MAEKLRWAINLTNPIYDPFLILTKVYNGKFLKQAIVETQIEFLNKARTVKICYGVLEKDIYLDNIIGSNTQKTPKTPIKIILKIALYMLEFMDKHDYMVVDNAVELTKKLGKEGAAAFVNAFLRSYQKPPLPQKVDEQIALETSTPLWLVKRVRRSYKGETTQILSEPSKGMCVRFVRGADEYLTKQHINTPFENVHIFPNFAMDENFLTGNYTFQSVGSVAICSLISPCENFLDACAAPGGKSVFLANKCKNVVSCDIHPHRVELIKSYAKRMNVTNITAIECDSSIFNSKYESFFDGVLCDVPCSGTGVINENPDIKLFREEKSIEELNKLQESILDNCAKYVKSGGKLYYSTCSILPEENDSIVYNFLQRHTEFTLSLPSSPLEHKTTKFGLQFLPHISLGVGFFVTQFIKK